MQVIFHGLAIAALVIPGTGLSQAPAAIPLVVELSQAQKPANTVIPIALPVNAKVWFKVGGATSGQVKGLNAQKQVLTLGGEAIPVARISKVAFDRNALVYKSNGTLVIRGEDNAQAKQSTWQNLALNALQLKDPKLGQAQVDLAGALNPLQLKGTRAVAVQSVYVVDEIQFQPAGKMTIKVTASDR